MAFTDNRELSCAVHEDGVNRVIRHIMRQRPSLFNYAIAGVAKHGSLDDGALRLQPALGAVS